MNDIIYQIPLMIMGSFIDGLFITSYYHKKKPIQKYLLFVFILTIIMIICNIFINNYARQIIMFLFLTVASYLFTKDKSALAPICFSIVITAGLDIPFYIIAGQTVNGFIMAMFVKLFLINAIRESKNHHVEFDLLSITIKFLCVLFAFLLFVMGKYSLTLGG